MNIYIYIIYYYICERITNKQKHMSELPDYFYDVKYWNRPRKRKQCQTDKPDKKKKIKINEQKQKPESEPVPEPKQDVQASNSAWMSKFTKELLIDSREWHKSMKATNPYMVATITEGNISNHSPSAIDYILNVSLIQLMFYLDAKNNKSAPEEYKKFITRVEDFFYPSQKE